MKDSILDGAANTAPVQSTKNSPSDGDKPPKGFTGTRVRTVAFDDDVSRRVPSVSGNAIGLNSNVSDTKVRNK